MKVLVYNTAADSSGAMAILKDFYRDVQAYPNKNIQWVFVVSVAKLDECDNIKVLSFPEIKKSWAHRILFEKTTLKRILREQKPDKIFSLQNVTLDSHIPQILYLHQPLPFVEKKYGFLENRLFWTYQNIISKIIYKSIKRAQKVIVQTEWMKSAAIKKTGVSPDKFEIISPKPDENLLKTYNDSPENRKNFFYPATALDYKNHTLLLHSCEILKNENLEFNLVLTLKGNENLLAEKLYKISKEKKLPIKFAGIMTRAEVFDCYAKSTLLFPSFIETFGMPLLEARLVGCFVVASRLPFSLEILEGYNNAVFFDYDSAEDLAKSMKDIMNKEYVKNTEKTLKRKNIIDLFV